MGRYCSVYDCKNKGTSTFGFPKDKTRSKQWEDFVNKTRRNPKTQKKIKKWKIGKQSCICSDHFEDSAFNFKQGKRLRLKNDAVPTLGPKQELAESSSQISNQQLAGNSSADIEIVLEATEKELESQQVANPPLRKKRKFSESVNENSPSNTDQPYVPSDPSTESEESCSRYIKFMFF